MIFALKLIYSVVFVSYMMIALVIVANIGRLLSLFVRDRKEFLFKVSRFWSRYLILPFVAKIRVKGLKNIPRGKPVIFVSNHQSYLDIPAILAYLPGSYRFIVKREYFGTPILGPYTKQSGHLSVDREVGAEAHKTLMEAVDLVKNGKSIIIFPEGTRTKDGRLGRFKRGGFVLAFETGAPIVPMAISGSHRILKRNGFLLSPGKIDLRIGEPIHVKAGKPNREIYSKTTDFVRARIEEMLTS